MKLAIIGSGPLAIEAALHFDSLGAGVTLFSRGDLGGSAARFKKAFGPLKFSESFLSVTTGPGRDLALLNKDLDVTFSSYFDQYLSKIINSQRLQSLVKKGDVLRVHKRFLSLDEEVEGRSRLHDLFRVVYSVSPKENILKQMEENPETFSKLGQDVLDSLQRPVESFEDFDLVIDATGRIHNPNPMGASNTFALNELNLSLNCPFYYGVKGYEQVEEVKKTSKNIVIVGSGKIAAGWAILLKDWLKESDDHSLKIITTEHCAFEKLSKEPLSKNIFNECREVLKENDLRLSKKIEQFEKDVQKWRSLESYEKAKIPAPREPRSQIEILNGHNVTSVDKLLDREGNFVTCESIAFRNEKLEKEKELITLACDAVLVASGHRKNMLPFSGLRVSAIDGVDYKVNEDGFFILGQSKKGVEQTLEDNLLEIKDIEQQILKFFSRV